MADLAFGFTPSMLINLWQSGSPNFVLRCPTNTRPCVPKSMSDEITYSSVRLGRAESLRYRYRPAYNLAEAEFGSLEFFLLERYRLFAYRRGLLLTGRVYHAPYRFGKAIVDELDSRLFKLDGFEIPSKPPAHAAYVRRVDVSIYPIRAGQVKLEQAECFALGCPRFILPVPIPCTFRDRAYPNRE